MKQQAATDHDDKQLFKVDGDVQSGNKDGSFNVAAGTVNWFIRAGSLSGKGVWTSRQEERICFSGYVCFNDNEHRRP